MNRRSVTDRKSFRYNFSEKRSTLVEFDIVEEGGKKVAGNITLTSNWRAHYPENPQIRLGIGGYGFYKDGMLITNGDIQQMIKRIFAIIDEVK